MRYKDKNQRNYIERQINTKKKVQGSAEKLCRERVLSDQQSENSCTGKRGEKLGSWNAEVCISVRSIFHPSSEFPSQVCPIERVVSITQSNNSLPGSLSYSQVTECVSSTCLLGRPIFQGHPSMYLPEDIYPRALSIWMSFRN